MLGVWANVFAIALGSVIGLSFRKAFTPKILNRFETVMGLSTILIGLKMALRFNSVFILLFSLVLGGWLGTYLKIEQRLEQLIAHLQKRFSRLGPSEFSHAFILTSMMFCTGAMAILGPVQAGASGDNEMLFAKASIDGVLSITLAAVYGLGVAFSVIPVMLYQGSFVLLARHLSFFSSPAVLDEVSGVGGLLLVMIGLNVSGIKKIAVGDFLPAIFCAFVACFFFLS